MNRPLASRRRLLALGAAGMAAATSWQPTLAQPATPSGAEREDSGSLQDMLARVSGPVIPADGRSGTVFTYADIARQLAVRGLPFPDDALEDGERVRGWMDGVDGLYLDSVLADMASQPELREMIGFGPADVTQTMTTAEPPRATRLYRGRFDQARIRRALGSSGYVGVETTYGPVLSIGAEGELDMTNPVQRYATNALNNIAVVDDHVIAGSRLEDVEATLAVFRGGPTSLAATGPIAALTAGVGEELVSAAVIDGGYLSGSRQVGGFADERTPIVGDPASTIGPVTQALLGITPGSMSARFPDEGEQLAGSNDDSAPRSDLVIALLMGSPDAAVAAVPIIERRLSEGLSLVTRQPYATLFERWSVEQLQGQPMVKIRISGDRVGRIWLGLLFQLDLGFILTE